MRILFISTLSLATNPRFYKEIMLAINNGFEVEVICFEFNNWSYESNKEILKTLRDIKVHIIPANRKPILPWISSVLTEKSYRFEGKIRRLRSRKLSQSVTRRSNLLLKLINELEGSFDLVVGHNPGSLYPTFYASEQFDCYCGFDVEDYHPGEGNSKTVRNLTKQLMNAYLPLMDYVTFAAPLMMKKHEKDLGAKGQEWQVILNAFPKGNFKYHQSDEGPLRLVWFSQNVNYERGLEQWIPALEYFKEEIELIVIGNKQEPFFKEYIEGKSFIKYLGWMEQQNLNMHICQYDIGLGLEIGKQENRLISITNKLITYYQAGLYIVASDTPGQSKFLSDYPHSGMVLDIHSDNFMDKLAGVIASKASIRRTKKERFIRGQQLNWEFESEKLLELWSQFLKHKHNF